MWIVDTSSNLTLVIPLLTYSLTYQDGKLDPTEVQHWIMPDDYDHAIAESKHLIYEADGDKV